MESPLQISPSAPGRLPSRGRWANPDEGRQDGGQSTERKKRLAAQTEHRPHQPAQVVAGGAEDGAQGVAQGAGEPAAVHAVIGLEMADRRLDCLTSLEPAALRPVE